MRVLITGAAGNLGGFLGPHLADGTRDVRLMIHKTPLSYDANALPRTEVQRADLRQPETLTAICRDVDCIVHFAGVLFAPRPEKFLARTNTEYARNLMQAAAAGGVKKFLLVSFPHVEGESSPEHPAGYRLDGRPDSIHAQTRLAAERLLFETCEHSQMTGVALRAGMIYGRGVLMVDAARWLLRHRLLGVWRKPTWIHLISLPDFLNATARAVDAPDAEGIYNLGDDTPITLQEFLDTAAAHWGHPAPWRMPEALIHTAALACEAFGLTFKKPAPLTRDFIRIGMASYWADTQRMRRELLPTLRHPSLAAGMECL